MRTIMTKVINRIRRLVQLHGPGPMKERLWSREFASGRWDCLLDTKTDFIYRVIGRYSNGGTILDLGCGSGNTGTELSDGAYRDYVGVDVSSAAVSRARERTRKAGREAVNTYLICDLSTYEPARRFTVILFRDSIYYVPRTQILRLLSRLGCALEPDGVFVVRMYQSTGSSASIVRTLEEHFTVLEKVDDASGSLALVFRPAALS